MTCYVNTDDDSTDIVGWSPERVMKKKHSDKANNFHRSRQYYVYVFVYLEKQGVLSAAMFVLALRLVLSLILVTTEIVSSSRFKESVQKPQRPSTGEALPLTQAPRYSGISALLRQALRGQC